jgi:putative DNA primase/helicase
MQSPFRVGWGWLVDQAYELELDFLEAEHIFQPDPDYQPPPRVTVTDDAVDFTDDWLAERLAGPLAEKLRYDYPNDRWHVWDGSRWAHASMGEQEREVLFGLRRLAAVLRAKSQALPDGKQKDRLFRTIGKLGNAGTLSNVTRMLQSHPRIVVGTDAFDQNLWELNTPGGTVDLTTGELRDHQLDAMHSKSTSHTPRPGAAPRWQQFLDEATQGNKDLQRYMQKLAGYSLTGVTYEQTMNFVWGPGGNGKGVFLTAITECMADYAATAPMDTFASSKGDKHPTDLAGLMGARLVTASETQKGRSWDEQRLKALTGGDKIRARFMRQDFIEFQPLFKLLIIGNHEPQIENVDDAMRRRIHLIPFTFKPPVRDGKLGEKLREEYPAILQWMIDGCLLWQKEGLEPPEIVLARTQEYFEEEDRLGLWLEESTGPGAYMTSADAYKSWQLWCGQQGEYVGTQRDFTKALRPAAAAAGYAYGKVGPKDRRVRGWKGVQLIENPNEIRGEL